MQTYGSRNRINPRPLAIRTNFAVPLLPSKPRLLDRIGPGAPLYVRQVKELAETAAFRAPTLGGVVAEHFRVQRLKGPAAFRTSPLSRMHRQFAPIIQRENRSMSHLQRLIDQRLRTFTFPAASAFQHPNDNFNVVFPKAVQPE